MELRVLQYFLAVTREQSILGAAESLHLSQPILSRQLKDMEEELGKQLFIRSNRRITLTEEGMILKKRAEEIMALVQKTENEITASDETVTGDIYIGGAESDGIRYLLRSAGRLQEEYPDIHFHVISGDQDSVTEGLDRGLIDFGIIFGRVDTSRYEYLATPYSDSFGVLMRKDDPLAVKDVISGSDLAGKPLILSRQSNSSENFAEILGMKEEDLNVAGSYNLIFNGSLMVEEGMGYAIGFDKIINTSGDSPLVFKPLDIQHTNKMTIIWKKYQVFAKPAQKFLDILQRDLDDKKAEKE